MPADPTALDFSAIRAEILELLTANRIVLPGVPETAQRVRLAATDPQPSLAEIASIAEQDPTLTAHLIKVSNLVAFRRGEETRTLRNAVTRLGARLTAVSATSFVILQMLALSPRHAPMLRALYRHSIEVGERSYVLALRFPRLNAEDALLAGMVHGIGLPVILQYIRTRPRLQATPVLEALIQKTQTPVGAELLRLWRFPVHITEAVAQHEHPDRGKACDPPDYADLLFAAKLGLTRESDHAFTPGAPPALARLGLRHNGQELTAARLAEEDPVRELCRTLKES